MKIYLVRRTDENDWDEYDAFVVVAENENEALSIARDSAGHGKWGKVSEVNPDKKGIVLGSFNAG